MISSRLPPSLEPNALSRAIDGKRRRNVPVIDLTESNPTRVGLVYPVDLLAPLADPAGLEYNPLPLGLWSARAAVASDFRRRGIVLSADRVAVTASTSEAYALLFKLLCDAGESVLVPRPSYPLFEHLTRLESITAVPYDLEYHGAWRIDLDSVRRAPCPGCARYDRVAEQPHGIVPSPRRPRGRRRDLRRAAVGDDRRRGVRRLPARPRAARRLRAVTERGPDLRARRPVEIRRPAAGQARMDRLRRTAARDRSRAGRLRDRRRHLPVGVHAGAGGRPGVSRARRRDPAADSRASRRNLARLRGPRRRSPR